MQAVGAEGIVSKRLGRPYRGGESRDWLKTKVFGIGRFQIVGFQELGARPKGHRTRLRRVPSPYQVNATARFIRS
jgi:ATP-dependent DNA ligase